VVGSDRSGVAPHRASPESLARAGSPLHGDTVIYPAPMRWLPTSVGSLLLTPLVPPRIVSLGDPVRVISDVMVKGVNCNGLVGDVVEDLAEPDAEEWGACCEPAWGTPTLTVHLRRTVRGFFDFGELMKLSGSKGTEIVEGDRVCVDADVTVKGTNTRGWEGTVVEVWTGCEVDPACCCNELATDAAIWVQLEAPPAAADNEDPTPLTVGMFDPDELQVVKSSYGQIQP
jgi:uncharacterized Zn ribbon protein